MNNTEGSLMTLDEFCDELMISRGVAYRLLKSGKIKCFRINKIWKIPRDAVQEYIQNQCNAAHSR